jgi:hypothetical protein
MKFRLLILVVSISFGNCSEQQTAAKPKVVSQKLTNTVTQEMSQLPFLDTVITISDRHKYSIKSKPLSDKEAENLLYDHFRSKGVLSRSEWQIRSTINKDCISVEYDSLYRIQTENLSGAVISYWLGPVDLNGHCFQPKKAIVLSTPKGYKIINEEFIPTSFIVDRTRGAYIYGEEYECGGRGTLRQFRIALK